MPIRVRRPGSAFSVLLLVASVPWTALAEVEDMDEADRWVPALSVSAGMLLQDAEASVETGDVLGPSFPNPNTMQPIRVGDSGDDLLITPLVGASLELMTPRVLREAWAPRFFVHAGVSGAFGPKRDIAKEGVIEDLALAEGLPNPADDEVTGQGSRARAEVERLVVRSGAGLAWTVEAFDRRFRVRTSVEYLREEITLQGAARRAVCIVPQLMGGVLVCGATRVGGIDDFREIDLRKNKTKDFHGIGPGIELETDVGRIGSIVPSISIGAQFFRFVGDRKISVSASNEFDETMSASFKKDPWAYRAGVGVRLRWIPE